MDNLENSNNNTQLVSELQKEIRGLKRSLALMESNLQRAQLVSVAQSRVEMIFDASLKKEIQFFQLILENSINILLLLDFDGRFAYASRNFLVNADIPTFGMINGRHYQDVLRPLISEDILLRLTTAVDCATTQRKTVTLETQIDFNFKGLSRTFSVFVTSMTDENNASTGIMLLFNDITEMNNALEAANRASLAKSNFLANMSHEIRTPLNAVIGMTAIAESSTDLEKIHYCLDKINDSSKHLLGVINDILDMSKIESDHFELSFSEFIFEKMLLRIVDVMRFKIEEKKIIFNLYCDPRIPYAVFSDEQRIAQVIMNLLSNAVKFTPVNGDVEIRVEMQNAANDMFTLRFSVKDSGIGISEEQKPRLFKVFSQADSSISRKFGGTGLGLVISKSIVKMLGGDIWFESTEGSGTEFIFNIKVKACQLSPEIKINRKEVRILAIDDMPDVRQSFSLYADKLGVPCDVSESANQALAMLSKQSYNIIFVDWKMPDVDGLSLVKMLDDISGGQMVVIMISAADWSEIEKEAKSAGVKEFVSKPILLPVIESILDKYCGDLITNETEAAEDFTNKTILLVDDVEVNREIIISLLEETGINIICAENGKVAVEKFITSLDTFDLIFMDLQMPEMDGYEATRLIREFESTAQSCVPIVAMTANVFKEDIERCLSSGMNDHIGKPIIVEEIYDKINHWTKKS